jgi:hypothetical protein
LAAHLHLDGEQLRTLVERVVLVVALVGLVLLLVALLVVRLEWVV